MNIKFDPNSAMKGEYPVPEVLLMVRLPFRLSRKQTADILNFRDEDSIGILVRHRMLPVLGNPRKGAPMWFATCVILALANNVKWLDRATRIISEQISDKNSADGVQGKSKSKAVVSGKSDLDCDCHENCHKASEVDVAGCTEPAVPCSSPSKKPSKINAKSKNQAGSTTNTGSISVSPFSRENQVVSTISPIYCRIGCLLTKTTVNRISNPVAIDCVVRLIETNAANWN